MRKYFLLLTVILVSILVACSSNNNVKEKNENEVESIDINEFVEITYEGLSSVGVAEYTVDYESIFKEIYNDELSIDSDEGKDALEQLKNDVSILLDTTTNLSNGDEIILSIESNNKHVKTTEKSMVVNGLEEPKTLTTDDVEKDLEVEFKGINGKGELKVYNMFEEPLHNLEFSFQETENLSNGDEVTLEEKDIDTDELIRLGYVLEEDFAPIFEVNGLTEIASTVDEIGNLNEIKEEIVDKMEDTKSAYFVEANFQKYDYTGNLETWMYVPKEKKPFEDEDEERIASLIAIYSMKDFDWNDGRLVRESTYVMGYYNLLLDENNNVEMEEIKDIDKTHSGTSDEIIKLYEEHGYKIVK